MSQMHPSRTGLLLGLAFLASLQVLTGTIALQHTRRLRDDAAWVAHTQEVLDAVQEYLTSVVDAETGQRGYLLTKNVRYLQTYHAAVAEFRGRAKRVKDLLQGDAREEERFRQIEGLLEAKLQELRWTIELVEKEPWMAQGVVQTHLGKNLMDAIRGEVEAIVRDEHALLSSRRRQSLRSYRVATVSGVGFALLGLLMTAGFLAQLLAHFRDRKQFEEALELQRQWLQVTLQSIGDGLIATDRSARVTIMNPAAGTMAGWIPEEAIGLPLPRVFTLVNEATGAPALNPGDRLLAEGMVRNLEAHTLLVRKDGHTIPVEDSAAPILDRAGSVVGMVLVFHDITERREADKERAALEARYQEAKNLETLVVLAGGVAHDFNNLLTSIMGNADLASQIVEPEAQVARYLEAIDHAAMRAADLTRQLLAYAGKGQYLVTQVNLNQVIKEVPVPLSGKVAIHWDLCDQLPLVLGDATQLAQVVGNLMTNAEEACGEGGQGAITVRTRWEHLSEAAILACPWVLEVVPGAYCTFEVHDPGVGMDPGVLARAFEPFYSTKFSGRGLGLAAVAGILRNHRGGLWVQSEPGHGSTFKVFLPALPSPGLQ